MGVKRGEICKKSKTAFPLCLDEFQVDHGNQIEKILKRFFPEVCAKIKGLNDTICLDFKIFVS